MPTNKREKPNPVRILASENNARGDLFARLMADLFIALGYDRPRMNVHKSGRELDLFADHRIEPRRAIAECKATTNPIGGGDINKFIGVVDAEKKDRTPLTPYFISLAGFTETALEQERQGRRTKVIPMSGLALVNELIKGRIVIPRERATELAGRLCGGFTNLVLDEESELLAHERGWIWAVYYTSGKQRTHFALIHSDGTPLAPVIAKEVIECDDACEGFLSTLTCLNVLGLADPHTQADLNSAKTAYQQYIDNECGYILLDGLPADSDVGSRRLRLETLFVPLHLDVQPTDRKTDTEESVERKPVGQVLSEHSRLALLAAPGGGKSTLLKRLAVAYVDPNRRATIDDQLPERDWLPLFFRCRELRGLARESFADLIQSLSSHEPIRRHAPAFKELIDKALLDGRVLLLVDGLDEISDPGARAMFVCTLRSALLAYPGTACVVTSREAGFRHIAAHLNGVCTPATVSTLDDEDIEKLSTSWHREVVGDTEKVRADAIELSKTIVANDRIKRLAENPLLLTTLLLVKRWVGSLPTRRAVLYGKAVEVLLMTWNTEGFDPIPHEEALPQLCYVASAMMVEGIQKVSRPRLAALLNDARGALPTELGYVQGTVDEFINRVEHRSSLLMMSGVDVERGRIVELFEFRHLTFQEYLTALAMVEGWHPGRVDTENLADVLEPYFSQEAWREVIPLAAVLGGKRTEPLIARLSDRVSREEFAGRWPRGESPALWVLNACLRDEAPARPETIRAALKQSIRGWLVRDRVPPDHSIVLGKYGADFREECRKVIAQDDEDLEAAGLAMVTSVWYQISDGNGAAGHPQVGISLLDMLRSESDLTRCEGAFGCVHWFFEANGFDPNPELAKAFGQAGDLIAPLIFSNSRVEQYAGCFALVWLGNSRVWEPSAEVLGRMLELGKESPPWLERFALWAFVNQKLISPENRVQLSALLPHDSAQHFGNERPSRRAPQHATLRKAAYLLAAWYTRSIDDQKIRKRATTLLKSMEKFDYPYIGGLALESLLTAGSDSDQARSTRNTDQARKKKARRRSI